MEGANFTRDLINEYDEIYDENIYDDIDEDVLCFPRKKIRLGH